MLLPQLRQSSTPLMKTTFTGACQLQGAARLHTCSINTASPPSAVIFFISFLLVFLKCTLVYSAVKVLKVIGGLEQDYSALTCGSETVRSSLEMVPEWKVTGLIPQLWQTFFILLSQDRVGQIKI